VKLEIPNLSLVLLVGASGSGKSTFAARHFLPTEVISSDFCRGLVSDDENDQAATPAAFELLNFIASKRMQAGRLTVIDATNVKREDRARLVALARTYHFLPVAIVFNLPERLCQERNAGRPDRDFGPHVIRNQTRELRRSLRGMRKEGFRQLHVLSAEDVDAATIVRTPLWNDRTSEHGPFDIVGDVHGCCDELEQLLDELGYVQTQGVYGHPGGRRAIFLGDLVDRGPRIVDTVRLVKAMVDAGTALCIPGNHDMKLVRKLRGREVQIAHGLDRSLAELEQLAEEERDEIRRFLEGLVSHYVLDGGKLVVAHAGMKEEMQGRGSGKVRDFALYGETTGETDEFGLAVRWNWSAEYRGRAIVVYGHTPVPEPEWLNRTINIDTGCVFGGRLTALRYPEQELVSVPAAATYSPPAKPLLSEELVAPALSAQQRADELLDIEDVLGKRIISTRLGRTITVAEENAAAALEVMGRFAIDPRWLVYLPPAVAPSETSSAPDLLEHPAEAFAYYRQAGVPAVVCEEKHMGSRAVVVVSRNAEVARERFGVADGGFGACYTRTGRRFFESELEDALLARVRGAAESTGLFDRLASDWLLFDCELMPWSAKAQDLIQGQYAAVGAAARAGLGETVAALEVAAGRLEEDLGPLLERTRNRSDEAGRFVEAYRRYCWPVRSVDDLRLAPFHLLASEGTVHVDKDHLWHLSELSRLCEVEDVLQPTSHVVVDTTDSESQDAATRWWEALTAGGGEGMVVKPLEFIAHGRRGLLQPALKTRGRDYLRIIYGPEYTEPGNLERLRSRGLGRKRSLAVREFALGIEALERFVRGEPLRGVHECVFGVLALESEPVDPRL
jgi:protein phosphatase